MAVTVESAYYTAVNQKEGWELIQTAWQTEINGMYLALDRFALNCTQTWRQNT
jgi:hypothetical protein